MAKRRVLVVDDDAMLANSLKRGLESSGPYAVTVQNDPTLARRTALEVHPDIVLLDVIMPRMDGGAVAADLRQARGLEKVPIVFLTSILDKSEAASRGGLIGDDPVLAKPVDLKELTETVERLLKV